MKAATPFFTVLLVLAVAQILTKALVIVLLILGLLGAFALPRQTFGLIALFGLVTLAQQKPAYCIAALGAIGVVIVITDRRQPTSMPPPLLTDQREGR